MALVASHENIVRIFLVRHPGTIAHTHDIADVSEPYHQAANWTKLRRMTSKNAPSPERGKPA